MSDVEGFKNFLDSLGPRIGEGVEKKKFGIKIAWTRRMACVNRFIKKGKGRIRLD